MDKIQFDPRLRDAAIKASHSSYSPYSKVCVGSAVFAHGQIFSGCNVENCSYGATICAERVAIHSAIATGARLIDQIYVYTKDGWTPCGICRQVIAEFASTNTLIIVGDEQKKETVFTISDLLPNGFLPQNLAE